MPWYSKFQNRLQIWHQTRIATCETFYTEVINFFSVNILKISENLLKIRTKMFTNNVDFIKLPLKNFVEFHISWQFWYPEYQGKKVIILVFLVLGHFMDKLSFEIKNCWAKCKLPCKNPGPTAWVTSLNCLPFWKGNDGKIVCSTGSTQSSPSVHHRFYLHTH